MGIEQQMKFNFGPSIEEKMVAAKTYKLGTSQEELDKLKKNEKGEWEYDGYSAESLLELENSNDNKDMYNIN